MFTLEQAFKQECFLNSSLKSTLAMEWLTATSLGFPIIVDPFGVANSRLSTQVERSDGDSSGLFGAPKWKWLRYLDRLIELNRIARLTSWLAGWFGWLVGWCHPMQAIALPWAYENRSNPSFSSSITLPPIRICERGREFDQLEW